MSDEERTYHDNNQLVDRIAYALRSFEGSLDLEDGSFVDPVQAAHNLQAYLSMWGLFIGYAPRVD